MNRVQIVLDLPAEEARDLRTVLGRFFYADYRNNSRTYGEAAHALAGANKVVEALSKF